ncbi:phosphoribosylamine--glycine ligase [Pseudoclavibacter soli]|uniref:phosphoribosylamine--glycine ligase n=1 Tax=Pseudoclavibacter soli TaxID=452623 RepID=UPI000412CA44|nr:phosphoribosylamine--glycine ligase [Pseudoclavibacter soli]
MKILILGSGAREHAIIRRLLADPETHEVTAAPGNAGIAADVPVVDIDASSPDAVVALVGDLQPDLVVVGPEAPLVAGVADAVRALDVPVFGPNRNAAQLEGSKSFAKRIMEAAGVPTAGAVRATTIAEVADALDRFGAPYVVKADGLAAGKGVIVTSDRDAALAHAEHWIDQSVLIEEFLDGQEISLFFLADGTRVVPLTPAQDYKRAFDGDQGPNTGGMGAYSPLPWLPAGFVDEVRERVAQPTVTQLAAEGAPFVGLLYAGLIVTAKGVRVIEFNARFGDPETQVVLPRLQGSFADLLLAAAEGRLDSVDEPQFSSQHAITVVLASEGYPEHAQTGRVISGVADAEGEGVSVIHAATEVRDGELIATGGRVLNVVAVADDFEQARSAAYAGLAKIHLDGSHHRNDIASAERTRADLLER